jgi:hypothetical protein
LSDPSSALESGKIAVLFDVSEYSQRFFRGGWVIAAIKEPEAPIPVFVNQNLDFFLPCHKQYSTPQIIHHGRHQCATRACSRSLPPVMCFAGT